MKRAPAALLIALAAGATGIALWAGPNPQIAGPAAATAVGAAALLFVGVGLDAWSGRSVPTPPAAPERDEFLFRFGFRSGRLGREEIVATLDRIERSGPTPLLPGRSVREVQSIVELPRADFREYVRHRIEDLEERV